MIPENIHAPGEGKPKNSTQMISMFVGGFLFILGLSGILFTGFGGMHLSVLYSSIIAASGAFLFYSGYKNRTRDAFVSCSFFTIFFGLHALAGWTLGKPGVPRVGFEKPDENWLVIIPRLHELGTVDHILNSVLAVVLLGGAIDWYRRHSSSGHRTDVFRDIKDDYKSKRTHTNRPIRH
jgi:hypothetical protein